MILSPVGNLWAFTHDNFTLTDLEQMEKIKTLFINKGNCYGDCVCVTKGVPIDNKNYRLIKFHDDLDILDLDDCLIVIRSKLCLIGIKYPRSGNILKKIATFADSVNSQLG